MSHIAGIGNQLNARIGELRLDGGEALQVAIEQPERPTVTRERLGQFQTQAAAGTRYERAPVRKPGIQPCEPLAHRELQTLRVAAARSMKLLNKESANRPRNPCGRRH